MKRMIVFLATLMVTGSAFAALSSDVVLSCPADMNGEQLQVTQSATTMGYEFRLMGTSRAPTVAGNLYREDATPQSVTLNGPNIQVMVPYSEATATQATISYTIYTEPSVAALACDKGPAFDTLFK